MPGRPTEPGAVYWIELDSTFRMGRLERIDRAGATGQNKCWVTLLPTNGRVLVGASAKPQQVQVNQAQVGRGIEDAQQTMHAYPFDDMAQVM